MRGNFWRRIRIRNQNQPITSGFWDIWGYVLEKWCFSILLRLCTGRKNFFLFFSQMSSFSTTLSLQNELLNIHERFFFTKIQPYQVLTFIRTTLWAFTLTLWCIPFCVRKFWFRIRILRQKLLRKRPIAFQQQNLADLCNQYNVLKQNGNSKVNVTFYKKFKELVEVTMI